jgi:hypothetical protein
MDDDDGAVPGVGPVLLPLLDPPFQLSPSPPSPFPPSPTPFLPLPSFSSPAGAGGQGRGLARTCRGGGARGVRWWGRQPAVVGARAAGEGGRGGRGPGGGEGGL